MPIWSQFMKRDKHSAGTEPVGEGKWEIAAGERAILVRARRYLDWPCDVRGDTGETLSSLDLRMPLQGQQCGSEGGTGRPGSRSYYFSQCDFGPLSLWASVCSSEIDHDNT